MTKAKKRAMWMACLILAAIVGGLLFGEFLGHGEILLAAITIICAFGLACCFIVLLEDPQQS